MPVATSRKGVGVYYVVVDGVPQHCQWQELKDYLRDGAKVNPGYANVLKVNEDGTRVGFCPLRSKADANHAFDYLVAEGWNGFDIRAWTGAKSSEKSDECSPGAAIFQQLTRRSQGANSTRSAPATSTPYSMSGMSQALPQVSYPTAAPNSRLSQGQYSQLAIHPPRYPYDQSITSTVPTPSTRSTVYATHRQHASTDLDDLIYTDQQSIHISRLPHDASAQDLQILLSRSGTVSNLSIKRGKEKRCSATARYKTPAEAAQAIRDLNGRKVGKMTLVVRYDRSEAGSTSSAPSTTSKGSDSDSSTAKQMLARTGPLVVDGAKGPGYHKRREDDDDSESTGDSSGDEGQATVKWPQGLLRQPTAKDGRR